jgi:hypothetical protein
MSYVIRILNPAELIWWLAEEITDGENGSGMKAVKTLLE